MRLLPLLLLLIIAAPAIADDPADSSPLADYLNDNYTVDGRIIIGGQPSAQVLESLQPNGVSTVINFRSRSEIEGLSFDQPELLSDADVTYHEIGIARGEDSYSPEKLAEFNALMEATGSDQVLLHCGSGYRASQMYAAWLVKYRGVSPNEALARVSPSGWWPMPLEQLLGQPLNVTVVDDSDS